MAWRSLRFASPSDSVMCGRTRNAFPGRTLVGAFLRRVVQQPTVGAALSKWATSRTTALARVGCSASNVLESPLLRTVPVTACPAASAASANARPRPELAPVIRIRCMSVSPDSASDRGTGQLVAIGEKRRRPARHDEENIAMCPKLAAAGPAQQPRERLARIDRVEQQAFVRGEESHGADGVTRDQPVAQAAIGVIDHDV